MKLSEFLSQQAVKAGFDVASEANKTFFEAAAALTAEIPDDLAKGIDNKFITVEAAKNNHPEIKNHYQSQALNTIDKNMTEVWKELNVSQDVIDEMMKEGSTFKRVPLAFKKIQELENRKANASKPDQQAIQRQIDDLQSQLRTEKETTQKTLAEKAAFEKNMRMQYRLNSMFANAKTIYDNLDPEEKNTALEAIVNRNLQDNNGKFDLDENGNLVLRKKDGTNYFSQNNEPVTPQGFIDGVLARKKIIVTAPAPNPNGGNNNSGPQGNNNGNQPIVNGNRNGGTNVSPLFKEHTDTALKELKDSIPAM